MPLKRAVFHIGFAVIEIDDGFAVQFNLQMVAFCSQACLIPFAWLFGHVFGRTFCADDSAMIMRVKFKTPPGEQFVIRKEVYRRMQEAFQEAGIEFAHRNVTVYLPSDDENEEDDDTKTMIEAGAAAAIAAEETQAGKEPKPQS